MRVFSTPWRANRAPARQGLDWALLRPDRYVFACGGHDQLPAALEPLRATVGAGLLTERDETMAVAS